MDRKTIAKVASYTVAAVALVSLIGSAPVQVLTILAAAATLKFYVHSTTV